MPFHDGLCVLVTGVCGTVGRDLLRKLALTGARRIIGIDINESDLYDLRLGHAHDRRVNLGLGDVRQRNQMTRLLRGVDVVYHAAAYKHVPLCEDSPADAIATNIQGTENVVEAAIENNCRRFLLTSTDKTVNPTNVMGTSKLMAERLVTAAQNRADPGQAFVSCRFGNVLGSRGSVVPIFLRQIRAGGPVTLTDPAMTRFVMSLDQATDLVVGSVGRAEGGEVLVTKMPVARIQDLAEVLIALAAPAFGHRPEDIAIRIVGPRPGEKMYEELCNEEEVRRTTEDGDYLVVHPLDRLTGAVADGEKVRGALIDKPYRSDLLPAMDRSALADFLRPLVAAALT